MDFLIDYSEELNEVRKHVLYARLLSTDMEVAYIIALGNSGEVPRDEKREAVFALATMFEGLIQGGIPVSEIGAMIARRRSYDTAFEDYEEFVNSLQTSSDEKLLLRTIVSECQFGKLTLLDVELEDPLIVNIPFQEGISAQDFAWGILAICQELKGLEVKVDFTPTTQKE